MSFNYIATKVQEYLFHYKKFVTNLPLAQVLTVEVPVMYFVLGTGIHRSYTNVQVDGRKIIVGIF